LIEIRLKAGYTQEQMAVALKTKKSNISRLENVNSSISPTIKTIERYANVAGYTLKKPPEHPITIAWCNSDDHVANPLSWHNVCC